LRRLGRDGSLDELVTVLSDWERWAAEILESHVSFPILGYFRSQHDNQSWLAALTVILDTSALSMIGVGGAPTSQARRTFAMARHAAVDLSQVLNASPTHRHGRERPGVGEPESVHAVPGRSGVTLADIADALGSAAVGVSVELSDEKQARLDKMRRSYEPYVEALAVRLLSPLPPLIESAPARDNWLTSPWETIADPGSGKGG
ncbi:MAG TPA: hypothetical protein VGS21_06375, partial [Acidimicrobiales bacterium]|nr:hypothetical protein [Acidimicrobiales bacterium]